MSRAERKSFPRVHSLYLSEEQDSQLRRYARRAGVPASEVMRLALADFLERRPIVKRKDDEPTPAQTRDAIAASARNRRLLRGPRNAPVLPRRQLPHGTTIWQPPPRTRDDDASECPLARDDDGIAFEPPANAVAWLVLHQRRADEAPEPFAWHGVNQLLVIALGTTPKQLTQLIGRRPGWIVLHAVDKQGRLLRTRQGVFTSREH